MFKWLKELFDWEPKEEPTLAEPKKQAEKDPADVILKTVAFRMQPEQMRVLHLCKDGSLIVDNRFAMSGRSEVSAMTLRFSREELEELKAFLSPDPVSADYRCTRCGKSADQCREDGCSFAPCPMALTKSV